MVLRRLAFEKIVKSTGLRIKELERLYGIQNGSTCFQGKQYSEVVPNKSEAPNKPQEYEQKLSNNSVIAKIQEQL